MKISYISSFSNNRRYRIKSLYALAFVLIFTVSFLYLEHLNRHEFVYKTSYNFQKLNTFIEEKDNIQILFTGDSHFIGGIDTRWFNHTAFSLSFGGANYMQSYYLLKHYIDEMPDLKLVVIPLDLHSFSSFRTDRITEPVFWNQFIDYSELIKSKGISVLKSKYFTFTLLDETFGKEYFIKNMKEFLKRKLQIRKPVERVYITRKEVDWDKFKAITVEERIQDFFQGKDLFDKDLVLYFEKILKLCREKGIMLITVQMPLSRNFLNLSDKYIQNEDIQSKIVKNPNYDSYNWKNLNYLEKNITSNELFKKDGDHLNKKGREMFSKLLAQDLSAAMEVIPEK